MYKIIKRFKYKLIVELEKYTLYKNKFGCEMLKGIFNLFKNKNKQEYNYKTDPITKNSEWDNLPQNMKDTLLWCIENYKKTAKTKAFIDKGIDAEKNKNTELAIQSYEKAIELRFEGSHPYLRLPIIYRKRKDYHNVIRVLKHAIDEFSNDVDKLRGDRDYKIIEFVERLNKAETLLKKTSKL